MKEKQKKSGISLIVLVITIIVIVILAVAVILSISNNNPISNANKAKFQNDVKSMQEDLELTKASNYASSYGESYGKISFSDLTRADKYTNKFIVSNGELMYAKNKLSNEEKEWANELGIKEGGTLLDGSVEGVEITVDDSGEKVFKAPSSWAGNREEMNIPDEVGKEVIIPEGVTKIGDNAFQFCGGLEKIVIPSTVKSIGASAFAYCIDLESIEIPSSVTSIGSSAFNMCQNLTSVKVPGTVKSIGSMAFGYCRYLKELILEEGIETIDLSLLASESEVKEIRIPSTVTSIRDIKSYDITITMSQKTVDACFAGKTKNEILYTLCALDDSYDYETNPDNVYLNIENY